MDDFRQLHLEITTRCRLLCEKCSRTVLFNHNQLKLYDLPIADFQKIVDSKQFNDFLFCGSLGDCIYHPQFLDMIKICKQNNISLKIVTNGSGKSKQWWVNLLELLDPVKDRLDFAIDGFESTVGKYRKNFTEKDFYKVIEIMDLAANHYKIKTLWTFIPMRFNEHQIEQAAKLALSMNVIFCVKKSRRWHEKNDPKIPINKKLIAQQSPIMQ